MRDQHDQRVAGRMRNAEHLRGRVVLRCAPELRRRRHREHVQHEGARSHEARERVGRPLRFDVLRLWVGHARSIGDQLSVARPPAGAYVVLARIASRSATARSARAGSVSRNAWAMVSYAKTYPSRLLCDGTSTQPRGRGRAAVSPPRYTPNSSAADRGTSTNPRPSTLHTPPPTATGRGTTRRTRPSPTR